MNNEQIQDWLTELGDLWKNKEIKVESWKKLLTDAAPNTHILLNYLISNFDDLKLIHSIIAQLLPLYYRLGVSRCFVLQIVPTLIKLYVFSLSKKWRQSADVFELFFLAIYNEEILEGGTGSPSMVKRVEEVRVPSVRFPSVYHDPLKLGFSPEFGSFKYINSIACVQNTVRIGPYPAIDRIIAENRFIVLTRIIRTVNNLLSHMSVDIIGRYFCLSLMAMCRNGFSFTETNFRQRILGNEASDEVFDDFAKKPRIPVSPHFLIESLNSVNFALFNGHADIALRALEAIHWRAYYEMFPDVLLQTNALRNSLLDPQTVRMLFDSEKIN